MANTVFKNVGFIFCNIYFSIILGIIKIIYLKHKATPILITGKISGTLNGHRLDDLELYSYVLTHSSDSRNFVAINKVPPNLGGSFQVLINVITPINWLFAGKNGIDSELKISNGFSNTGTMIIIKDRCLLLLGL